MSTTSKHIVPTCHCMDVFSSPYDLRHHADNNLCTVCNVDSDMETNYGSGSDTEEDISNDLTCQHLLDETNKDENVEKRRIIVDRNIENGMDEDDAKVKADKKMTEADKSLFKTKLLNFMLLLNGIRYSKLMRAILNDYDAYDNMSVKKAMKKAMKKHMDQFDELFEEESDEDTDEESDMESEYDEKDNSVGGMQDLQSSSGNLKPYKPDVDRWKTYFSGAKIASK